MLNDGTCPLTFDYTTNMFVFNTRLTGCGIQVNQIIETEGRFITFTNSISLPEQAYKSSNVSVTS